MAILAHFADKPWPHPEAWFKPFSGAHCNMTSQIVSQETTKNYLLILQVSF